MAQPFTAKLGTFDFSDYLRVAEDVEPTSVFEDPAFSDAPLAEGQPLISLDAKNREMAWPLFLNAASKDALHALIRTANQACSQGPPLQLEWKDAGATQSTFYDVTYARFEPAFNYRRGVQGWLAGTLRVYCAPPYGHTGTARVAATAAGTGPVLSLTLPTQTQGDADAQVDFRIYVGSQLARPPMAGRIVGAAVLPNPAYVHEIPAASLLTITGGPLATISGASGAVASQVRFTLTSFEITGRPLPLFRVPLSPASAYIGANRVFAIARTNYDGGIAMRAFRGQDALGATAIATSMDDWQMVDLGVLRVDSRALPATLNVDIYGSVRNLMEAFSRGAPVFDGVTPRVGVPTGPINMLQVTDVLVLPEESTQYVIDKPVIDLVACEGFNKPGTITYLGVPDELGNNITIPKTMAATALYAPNSASSPPFAWSGQSRARSFVASGPAGLFIEHPGVTGDMYIRAAFAQDLGIMGASSGYGVRKAIADISSGATYGWIELAVRQASSAAGGLGSHWLVLSAAQGGFTPTVLASMALNNNGNARYLLELWTQDRIVTANVRDVGLGGTVLGPGALTYASVGATWVAAGAPAYTEAFMWAQSGGGNLALEYVQTMALASQPIAARDQYELNGVADERYQAVGGTPGGAGGVPARDITITINGRTPLLAGGTTGKVVVFAMDTDSGPANDILNGEIRVRERFRYAR